MFVLILDKNVKVVNHIEKMKGEGYAMIEYSELSRIVLVFFEEDHKTF